MTEEKIKKKESERTPKTEEIKEKKESERNPKTEEKIEKKDDNIKNGEEEETEKEPENLFYCFNKEEISLIKELKEKKDQDIRNGVEELKDDDLKSLYTKVEVNMIDNEKIFTDYIVLYLPNNFNQLNSVKYEYRPMFTKIYLGLERSLNGFKYAKKNKF